MSTTMALAGCGGSTDVSEQPPGQGAYLLQRINGTTLPTTVITGNERAVQVFAGAISIVRSRDRSAEDFLEYNFPASDSGLRLRSNLTISMAQTGSGKRSNIVFSGNADRSRLRPVTGWAEGDSLVLEAPGEGRWVYRRE